MLKFNQVLLTGVLSDKPSLDHLPSGTAKATLTVAAVSLVHGEDRKQFLPAFMLGKGAEQLATLDRGDVVMLEAEFCFSEWGSGASRRNRLELKVLSFEKVTAKVELLASGGPSMLQVGALNRALVAGRLASDPTMAFLQGGAKVAELRLAVDGSYRKGNEWVDCTHWVDVAARGDAAEQLLVLRKGDRVLLEGGIERQLWDNPSGPGKHSKLRLAASAATLVKPAGAARSASGGQGVVSLAPAEFEQDDVRDAVDEAEALLEGNTDQYLEEPRLSQLNTH